MNSFALLKSKKPGNNLVKILSIKIIDFAKLKERKARNGEIKINEFNSKTSKSFFLKIFFNLFLLNLLICSCL